MQWCFEYSSKYNKLYYILAVKINIYRYSNNNITEMAVVDTNIVWDLGGG